MFVAEIGGTAFVLGHGAVRRDVDARGVHAGGDEAEVSVAVHHRPDVIGVTAHVRGDAEQAPGPQATLELVQHVPSDDPTLPVAREVGGGVVVGSVVDWARSCAERCGGGERRKG